MSINILSGGGAELPVGHYENFVPWTETVYASQTATDTEPYVIHPRPDSETDADARHRWAHDQMIYEVPIYMRGGGFPYNVEIDTDNTSAALLSYITITNNWRNITGAPSCYVRIPPAGIQSLTKDGATAYTIQLKAVDQDKDELKVWWSFIVEQTDQDHFVFVDNSNTGTKDGDWATPYDALDTATTSTASSGNEKILVIKEGNSQSSGSEYTKTNNWLSSTTEYWNGVINNPADTNRPVVDLDHQWAMFGLPGASAQSDAIVWGIEVINGDNDGSTEGYGAFFRFFNGASNRLTLANLKLDTVTSWNDASNYNVGCITLAETDRTHVAICDIEICNIAGNTATDNVGGAGMLMGLKYGAIDNWNIHDFGTGANGAPMLMIFKHRYTDSMMRRITAYDYVRCN